MKLKDIKTKDGKAAIGDIPCIGDDSGVAGYMMAQGDIGSLTLRVDVERLAMWLYPGKNEDWATESEMVKQIWIDKAETYAAISLSEFLFVSKEQEVT